MTKYGPHNPHPLSTMRTELVWEGKYDEFGQRREADVARLSLPLQKIETIDEPRSRAEGQGELFDEKKAHRDDFRNHLIWGDNKIALASLLSEFKGAIDLVYIDPPFNVGADFSLRVPLGEREFLIEKEQSILEMIAYRDIWGKGVNSYASMLFDRIRIIYDLLSHRGSLYVHVGPEMGPIVRCIISEVFGPGAPTADIVWKRVTAHGDSKRWGVTHDFILWTAKSDEYIWTPQYESYSKEYLSSKYRHTMPDGRKYRLDNITSPNPRPNMTYEWRGCPPPVNGWRYEFDTMERLYAEGRIEMPRKEGGRPQLRRFLDEQKGVPVGTVWTDIHPVNSQADEDTGYNTQKPEALLERIIDASSTEDSIIADVFCGSGTTLAVAEKLGRRWIGCDLGRFAIHSARKRLIGVQRELHAAGKPYRSLDLYNLGRYERQWWQSEALKGADDEHRKIVLRFFRAEELAQAPSPLLHARKGTAFVHVDGIDSIFSRGEVAAVAEAVKAAGGREVHCLAWDFEMDIRQVVAAAEAEHGVKVRLHRIPREIMERNRTEVPPFFEVALLEAAPVYRKGDKGRKVVDIKLENFLPSLTEVPSKELEALQERAVQSGFDFIDFWAVDFDWKPGMPFNHHWQDYRTRKGRTLKTVSDAEFAYDRAGRHTACIKVVDVFGCDTSITVEVEV
jgi:DNA modification methylase